MPKHTDTQPDLPSAAAPCADDKLPVRQTKAALVLTLLTREQGATLAEMVAATGWQAHTVRAALTGVRKKGHAIDKRKSDKVTCYHVVTAA